MVLNRVKPVTWAPMVVITGVVLAATVGMVGLVGCNGGTSQQTAAEVDSALQQKVAELEAENQAMRSQLGLTQNPTTNPQTATSQAKATAELVRTINNQLAQIPEMQLGAVAFNDVQSLPTYALLDELNQLGLFKGLLTGPEFKPYQPITRSEYITWLFKAYNMIQPENEQIRLAPQRGPIFSDLPKTHPAYPYVQAMSDAGFSVGYVDGTFRPDQPLTREEMVAIKWGVDTGTEYKKPSYYYDLSFTDRDKVDERYKGYVYYDNWQGGGPHKGNINRAFGKVKVFKPQQPVLRYEAAATLWQVDGAGKQTAQTRLASIKAQ